MLPQTQKGIAVKIVTGRARSSPIQPLEGYRAAFGVGDSAAQSQTRSLARARGVGNPCGVDQIIDEAQAAASYELWRTQVNKSLIIYYQLPYDTANLVSSTWQKPGPGRSVIIQHIRSNIKPVFSIADLRQSVYSA
jgi:hypothetical protein